MRYEIISNNFNNKTLQLIQNSYILVIGAGGIGCEVLKNLVLSGFLQIDLIDLDTVDISNLNRQFLFRPEHVNKPKSIVAAISAMNFNPEVKITAYHKNIKDPDFNRAFFSKYKLVLNALDNVDARRHVNRLCLAFKIPLIESGTTGYIGQAMPIIKNITECYECQPKVTQKVYPICTIRSTPSQPVHCIVWAKELFKLIFGNRTESLLYEDESTEESTFMKYLPFPNNLNIETIIEYTINLLKAFFCTEIEKKMSMGLYKSAENSPNPLNLTVFDNITDLITQIYDSNHLLKRPSERKGWERTIWNETDCIIEIICSFITILLNQESKQLIGSYSFDKDDRFSMIFVTAASVLRSQVFHIQQQSYHDAKGIAGNIIPAIASTNAIIAGLQVIEAIRLLNLMAQSIEITTNDCRTTFCQRMPTRRGYYLQPTRSSNPNPNCYICGTSQLTIEVDTKITTLETFINLIIKQRLGLVEPSLMVGTSIIYEEGEDSDESLSSSLKIPLISCPGGGIKDGTIISLSDYRQDIEISLVVSHVNLSDFNEEENPNGFRLIGSHEVKTKSSENIEEKVQETVEEGNKTTTTLTLENKNENKKRSRQIQNNINDIEVVINDVDENDDIILIEDGPAKKKVSP